MQSQCYSERLGAIAPEQFQAALDRFDLGGFLGAAAIPFGLFGQNVFVSSSTGEYVLRAAPHGPWQFPAEQFFANQLHGLTLAPVPWPYLIDPTPDIFGWSYVLMPRMPGLQLADPEVRVRLPKDDRRGIARALGHNLARMQVLTWPFPGRYDPATSTVQPLELQQELAWPFLPSVESESQATASAPLTYAELLAARIRHHLVRAQQYSDLTTRADIDWTEEVIAQAGAALAEPFQPCLVMEDYIGDMLRPAAGEVLPTDS